MTSIWNLRRRTICAVRASPLSVRLTSEDSDSKRTNGRINNRAVLEVAVASLALKQEVIIAGSKDGRESAAKKKDYSSIYPLALSVFIVFSISLVFFCTQCFAHSSLSLVYCSTSFVFGVLSTMLTSAPCPLSLRSEHSV